MVSLLMVFRLRPLFSIIVSEHSPLFGHTRLEDCSLFLEILLIFEQQDEVKKEKIELRNIS